MTTATQPTPTREQLVAALRVMGCAVEAIREAGRMPEGVLYAAMMDHVSLDAFRSMCRQIVATGLVQKIGVEFVWVG